MRGCVVNRRIHHEEIAEAEAEGRAVVVHRPSKWGNPFRPGVDGSRAEVLRKYEAWLRGQPHLMAALPELRGKVLICWCAPKPCHAEILLRLAEEAPAPPPEHPF